MPSGTCSLVRFNGVRARFRRARTYVRIDANGRASPDLPHIRNDNPGVTNQNGAVSLAFLQAHDLRAENTFWPVGHACRALRGGTTARIDCVCVDFELPDESLAVACPPCVDLSLTACEDHFCTAAWCRCGGISAPCVTEALLLHQNLETARPAPRCWRLRPPGAISFA